MNPEELRSELAEADAARRAAAAASATPPGVIAGWGLAMAVGGGLLVTFDPVLVVLGLATIVGVAVLVARATRRRGQVTDGPAIAARMTRYAVTLLPAVFFVSWAMGGLGLPWRSLLFGGVMAAATCAYMVLDERYQLRRIAQGGLKSGDLT